MQYERNFIHAVRTALSPARMGTYEAAVGLRSEDDPSALLLYAWNAEVSAALLTPLHLCEVVIRNCVADALQVVYGSDWPWSPTFEQSLPHNMKGYSQRRDLQHARRNVESTGKVVPELKFVFWQKMFTRRFDMRIWDSQLRHVMPNLEPSETVRVLRESIYSHLENVRLLRNRIAHHEPVFSRMLADDYQIILTLVKYRCTATAMWLDSTQKVSTIIAARP